MATVLRPTPDAKGLVPLVKLNRSGTIVECNSASVQYAVLEKGLSFGNNGGQGVTVPVLSSRTHHIHMATWLISCYFLYIGNVRNINMIANCVRSSLAPTEGISWVCTINLLCRISKLVPMQFWKYDRVFKFTRWSIKRLCLEPAGAT